jgi:RAB protein geranylgeranyltransferase component A
LSRSDKKILHVDQNEYYGADEAAFSLQDIDEWAEKSSGGLSSLILLVVPMLI